MAAQKRTYLDHNATAPLRLEAKEAMLKALELPCNASSIHGEGRKAKAQIEKARMQIAALVGAEAENIVFVSGATEAINMICQPKVQSSSETFWPLASEHAAVLAGHGFTPDHVRQIKVDAQGSMDLGECAPAAGDLLGVQLANSETGVIQKIDQLKQFKSELDSEMGNIRIFSDCVQAAGKIKLDITNLRADVICISSHKLGGPQGAAAIIAKNLEALPKALILGGGQEKGRRGGTENVAAIAGFGAAAQAANEGLDDFSIKTSKLRDEFEAGMMAIANKLGINCTFHGPAQNPENDRLSNTSCFSIGGIDASTALMLADLNGIAISSGSACSSGKVGKSHVLSAMGVSDELAKSALRVSLGWNSQQDDIAFVLEFFERELPRLLS